MNKQTATITRKTNETDIEMQLSLNDGSVRNIDTKIGFLNHMLDLFAKHGNFNLSIKANGDIQTDEHHLIEDIGIVLGQAFLKAIGDKKGVNRYGFFILPMDEVLTTVAVDMSGRYSFNFNCEFRREKVGDLPTELVYDFWNAFAQNVRINLFIKVENGRNEHHMIEAIFKCTARALKIACEIQENAKGRIPSTKGVL